MKEQNNIIEIGSGDIAYVYDNPRYKLQDPESPITKMWTEQYKHLLETENRSILCPETKFIFACCGISIINNHLMHIPYIHGIIMLGSIAALAKQFYAPSYRKHEKFEYAILNYQDLKRYEELHPTEKSVINNKTLKGISKRKMKKRVESVQKN
ncbi:MAG: hypothetical protein HFH45_04660 [Bacilli bacterium]|nr:hypothetical protein [Bacilli bacterium]